MKTLFYYSNSVDREREFVRIRDNHTCQICKRKWNEKERRFHIHHLSIEKLGKSREKGIHLYDRDNNEKLVTLCPKCHKMVHLSKESEYFPK